MIRIVYNKLLGGWYVVRGPHQTPLNGRFDSKAEAQAWLDAQRAAQAWHAARRARASRPTIPPPPLGAPAPSAPRAAARATPRQPFFGKTKRGLSFGAPSRWLQGPQVPSDHPRRQARGNIRATTAGDWQMTQQQIDRAYNAGRAAFRAAYGVHGPTCRERTVDKPVNPHVGVLAEAWERGWRQDVRRLHAGQAEALPPR